MEKKKKIVSSLQSRAYIKPRVSAKNLNFFHESVMYSDSDLHNF